jgi:hypothetical protein
LIFLSAKNQHHSFLLLSRPAKTLRKTTFTVQLRTNKCIRLIRQGKTTIFTSNCSSPAGYRTISPLP